MTKKNLLIELLEDSGKVSSYIAWISLSVMERRIGTSDMRGLYMIG